MLKERKGFRLTKILCLYEKSDNSATYAEIAKVKNEFIGPFKPLSISTVEELKTKVSNIEVEKAVEKISIGLIPSNVLFFNGQNTIIWHVPSKVQNLSYDEKTYRVKYPHMIFKLKSRTLYAYEVKVPRSKITPSTKMYLPNLCNIESDGRVCMGAMVDMKLGRISDPNKIVEIYTRTFFQTEFSNDYFGEHQSIFKEYKTAGKYWKEVFKTKKVVPSMDEKYPLSKILK